MSLHPEILWAQRSSESEPEKNIIFFTVNLPDLVESSIEYELTPSKITFKAKAGTGDSVKDYAFSIDFFAEVDPEASTKRVTSRSFVVNLRKKEAKAEYWPRISKEKGKIQFIKTDFSKWVDEDEQDGAEAPEEEMDPMGGAGGMPPGFGGMGGMPGMGMPGMGGMGGMDFEQMMASMGGAGGAGGAPPAGGDEEDSDDEGPPPLEDAEPPKP